MDLAPPTALDLALDLEAATDLALALMPTLTLDPRFLPRPRLLYVYNVIVLQDEC